MSDDGNTVLLTRDPDELQRMVHELRQHWRDVAGQRDSLRARLCEAEALLREQLRHEPDCFPACGVCFGCRLRVFLSALRDARPPRKEATGMSDPP